MLTSAYGVASKHIVSIYAILNNKNAKIVASVEYAKVITFEMIINLKCSILFCLLHCFSVWHSIFFQTYWSIVLWDNPLYTV